MKILIIVCDLRWLYVSGYHHTAGTGRMINGTGQKVGFTTSEHDA